MAKKRLSVLENLLKSALKLDRSSSMKDRFWLWRSSLLSAQADPTAGFVLPTVTLLLLMLSLILGVLIFRTGNRTTEVIGDRQQRQVYNAATPAVERAKAKLEYLFTQESIPVLPSEEDIETALRTNDIYTLDDEKRVDLNGGGDDNAWTFLYDSQGLRDDTTDDVRIVYSILSRASRTDNAGNTVAIQDNDLAKAGALVVRNGPINLTGGAGNPNCPQETRSPFQGWQRVTGAELRKSLQVHAVAIPGPDNPSQTRATLEFQQDKVANLGNKWGAWFRIDMEIFPGAAFRMNGAMNTAGSYYIGDDNVSLYPISSAQSCVYTKESSEMVMRVVTEQDRVALNGGQTFQSQSIIGTIRDNAYGDDNDELKLFPSNPPGDNEFTITSDNDSVETNLTPTQLALEPVSVLTEALNRRRDGANPISDAEARDVRDVDWQNEQWVTTDRHFNKFEPTPFVDDTYRADDRWGPKPVYQEDNALALRIQPGVDVSDPVTNEIPDSVDVNDAPDLLTRLNPLATSTTDEQGYGLDGYWERRARAQGVRFIVGQRLELGNTYGWLTEVDLNGDGDTTALPQDTDGDGIIDVPGDVDFDNDGVLDFDPLYPPPANPAGAGSMALRQHELMQWKTLRSNPAAAQSTAIYHYLMNQGSYPVACLASAAHPGTRGETENPLNRANTLPNVDSTIGQSTRFEPIEDGQVPDVNFLIGKGTNGWEFAPYGYSPYEFDTFQGGTGVTHAGLVSAHNKFETDVNSASSALRVALSNLANFSGDLKGAFPPIQDVQGAGAVTHPYPIQTMWGDFSNLRRVLDKLENGATYSDNFDDATRPNNALSLADQTTLQTASCTLGILAYNLDNALGGDGEGANYRKIGGRRTRLINSLTKLSDGIRQNGEIEINGGNLIVYQAVDNPADTPEEIYQGKAANVANPADTGVLTFNPDPANRRALSVPVDVLVDALPTAQRELAEQIQGGEQLLRDRLMGFAQGGNPYIVRFNQPNILGQNLKDLGVQPRTTQINLQCDYESTNYFGLGRPTSQAREKDFLTLAFALCPRSAKYPSLYYLFPAEDHDHIGTNTRFVQPDTEPYTSRDLRMNGERFDNAYGINSNQNPIGSNDPNQAFRVVGDLNGDGKANDDNQDGGGFAAIALRPQRKENWALPANNGNQGPNTIVDAVSSPGTDTEVRISLLDKGLFDGREQMAIRVLDIDLDLLRRNTVTGSGTYKNQDYWMPLPTTIDPDESPSRTGGAFYAFREDAVREDGIARPRSANPTDINAWRAKWLDFSDDGGAPPADYVMNAAAFNTSAEQDPPVNPDNGLSPKAVDFYPDPARRPHGFRLQRGADLRRIGPDLNAPKVPLDEDERGMSFISDNAVYIQGDFNLHQDDAGNPIEEFKGNDVLNKETWANFFDRADLDTRFARPEEDAWRATEIVADAVTILSNRFVDGWLSEGVTREGNKNPRDDAGEAESSFEALNQVLNNDLSWVRIDGRVYSPKGSTEAERSEVLVPIKISQRGFPVYCSLPNFSDASDSLDLSNNPSCAAIGGIEREYGLQDGTQTFLTFADVNKSLIKVDPTEKEGTTVNAIIVSGLIPSRLEQSNGGLHNFPRFIENWRKTPSRFNGSMFQLNFSNASTGQSDQDSWEPGRTGADAQNIYYYIQPNRQWGYDVGLQYVGPSPVAQRFAGRANIRSEFYQELSVDDPYIVNLRCVDVPNGGGKADRTCPR